MRSTALFLVAAASLLAACGGDVTTLPSPRDGSADAPSPDAATPDDAPAADAGPRTWTPDASSPATPIEAPMEEWAWVPFPDSACGNGTPAGLGVNLTRRSNRVLIFMMGGGGCWDTLTCHLVGTAAHLNETYDEDVFTQEMNGLRRLLIFSRTDMRNPFRDASFVFVPYCTGDIHGGNHVATYVVGGQERTTYHVGARNVESYLRRLAITFPQADRVWLTGTSAGGYGAGINWDRVQRAFPRARVDLLDDSGPPITPPAARYQQMQAAWNLQFPEGCTRCADDLGALFPYYRERFPPPHRMGLLSYTRDGTISTYFGVTGAQFETQLGELARANFDPAPNFRYFFVTGSSHTLVGGVGSLTGPGGASLLDWVTAWATDATPWNNVRP